MDCRSQLSELLLKSNVRETGRELGRGAYGVVVEVEVNGLRCAAKKLHPILLETDPEGCRAVSSRFVEECNQHSRQRHPNIVQLLGVYFPSPKAELPLMVMELMEMSLCACLERHPNLVVSLKNDILIDVGQGLLHLHSQQPPIIHRDLTANNVLLTSELRAKIADLGVARIVKSNPSVQSAKQTVQPGTLAYMPPEALSLEPSYNTKLDVFSFGVLILHVFTNKWPIPTLQFVKSPDNPKMFYQVSEVDRRTEYLKELGENHHHMNLVHSCLSDEPDARPTTDKVLASLRIIKSEIGSYPSRRELAMKKG